MAAIDDVLRRLGEDPGFRSALDDDPALALREYALTPQELARVEDAVRSSSGPTAPAEVASGGGRGAARLWLTGAVAAAALAGGLGLGASGAVADPKREVVVPREAVAAYDCTELAEDDGTMVGVGEAATLHRADRVFIIGRSADSSWLAIRDHRDLSGPPVWVQAAYLVPDEAVADLPELDCETRDDETPTPLSPDVTTTTSVPAPDATTTTVRGQTTTTTVAGSTTTQPAQTTTTKTPSTQPPVTQPGDTAGPSVTVTADESFVYTDTNDQPCAARTTLDLTVSASDPSAPVTITAVTWTYTGRDGSTKEGAAQHLGGNRYRVGPLSSQVPLSGSTSLKLTATARDARGNTASGTRTVKLQASGDDCIG